MDRQSLLNVLKCFTQITSLSSQETNFLKQLKLSFFTQYKQSTWRQVSNIGHKDYSYNDEYCLLLNKKAVPYLFIVHTDRVFVGVKVQVEELNETQIQSQLDNIISIAILYLLNLKYPINILFTTREEQEQSASQIEEVLILYPYLIPISVDIDIYAKSEPINRLSLRTYDRVFEYDISLVSSLKQVAIDNNIPFSNDELGYTMAEAGYLGKYTCGKMLAANIGIPIYNYHSASEIASWNAIEGAYNLVEKLLQKSSV